MNKKLRARSAAAEAIVSVCVIALIIVLVPQTFLL
jgi:hypothetical protein